ncbi:MAG TPA: NUDIX hydrolase [Candidatus Saccharimonadales bacterium]|nr:NUDIX hydrolase [Candidatus Saccharimonadales bacterium]
MSEGLKAGGLLWVPPIPRLYPVPGLVLVWREGSGRSGFVIPKGTIEQYETPRQAAERELLEETGYRAWAGALLEEIVRPSIDVDSQEKQKRILVFHMHLRHDILQPDPAITPDEDARVVTGTDFLQNMRYPQEQLCIARNIGKISAGLIVPMTN